VRGEQVHRNRVCSWGSFILDRLSREEMVLLARSRICNRGNEMVESYRIIDGEEFLSSV
jgi:hypothetical protein